jgi:hypothetical protein
VFESPIPKSGKSSDPANYIISSDITAYERIIFQSFYPLSAQQWGFTQGKLTIGALLAATDHWHSLLDSGLEICTVFFDYIAKLLTQFHADVCFKSWKASIYIPLILHTYIVYLYMGEVSTFA